MKKILFSFLVLLSNGCSTKKILDRSLVNNHGMDFQNYLSIPKSPSKYFLGGQTGQVPAGGCYTCAK